MQHSAALLSLPGEVAPETEELTRRIEDALRSAPPMVELEPQAIRDAREQGLSVFGEVVTVPEAEMLEITHCGCTVPIRIVAPKSRPIRGIYLHIHGGGWTLGAAHHADVRNRAISRLGLVVASVEYRLAPEHPYPAAPDDCEAVADWLLEGGVETLTGAAGLPLLIGGESAGAHLALVTLLRLRNRRGQTGFAAANLVYGCYDLALTPSAATWGERNLILSTPIIRWFTAQFLSGGGDVRAADVSPLYADLSNLPPALLTVGTLDPLLDDSLFLWARLRAAGVAAELAPYAGGIHAFNAFPIPLATAANGRIDAFLESAL